MSYEKIDEMFVLPSNTKKVENTFGIDLYTSDTLREKLIYILKGSSFAIPYMKEFERLIDKEYIIPVFFNKNIFSFVFYKVSKGNKLIKSIGGIFDYTSKKIYIIFDNSLNIIGYTSKLENFVATTIHETAHMFAALKRKEFENVFSKELNDFYTNFFSIYFQVPNLEMDTGKFVSFLLKSFEVEDTGNVNSKLKKYYDMLRKEIEPFIDPNETLVFLERLQRLIVAIKIFILMMAGRVDFIFNKFRDVIDPLYTSYDRSFGKQNDATLCFQELISPSEVIAVYSEFGINKNKIKKALSLI